MPHQCTNCGHVFEDGSKEMLSGCPDCGGNKFQYHPGEVPEESSERADDAEPPEPEGGSVSGAVGRAANRVRDAVSSGPSGDDDAADASVIESADGDVTTQSADAPPEPAAEPVEDAVTDDVATDAVTDATDAPETGDGQTADAAVDPNPAVDADAEPGVKASTADSEDSAQAEARSGVVDMADLPDRAEDGRVVKEPDDSEDRPDLEDLRQELNDQFESIRIVAPGQYELNLMELYDRQEYIIALQEDGQYVIEVPDAWEAPDPTDAE
ncbi:OapC/ArvC family zinc-ribbon domain-containing protein [Halobacterium jilantaiense]|uniref:Zn-ribbon containing protein n=1 Tax=Halobacterium jilantaiense TaxID=355548 RepID=A0A1I0PNV3_9EURY|nr:Zn-ribbon containing protein [Halobacterium jilantaiense]SEW16042.1 hypothetical protein SAMN04487945_1832 [Halobacterium jilantaiense]